MQNIVIGMCEKFHYDRTLRNDKALGNRKSDNKNPFPGPMIMDVRYTVSHDYFSFVVWQHEHGWSEVYVDKSISCCQSQQLFHSTDAKKFNVSSKTHTHVI